MQLCWWMILPTYRNNFGAVSTNLGICHGNTKSDWATAWIFDSHQMVQVVGHLFLDQFPRDGKFSHQMIVPLAPAFVSRDGEECLPACVNISNLPRSEGGRPALLRWSEMKTLFHEFLGTMGFTLW